jgi:hypothetical protein
VNDTQTAALGISGDSGQLFATGTFNIMQKKLCGRKLDTEAIELSENYYYQCYYYLV